MSTKFIGDLLKLEKELEIAIGLRDGSQSLVSSDDSITNSDAPTLEAEIKPTSASGRKYTPGKKRGKRLKELNESFIVSQQPESRMNTQNPHSQQVAEEKDIIHPRPPSYPQKEHYSLSRASTPAHFHEKIRKNLASRGLVITTPPDGMTMAEAEFQITKGAIENILSIARDISQGIGKKLDSNASKDLFKIMNERVLDSTKAILKTVKAIDTEEWVKNRDFMAQTIKRLRMSTFAMQSMLSPPEEELKVESDSFNLGVIKGGEVSDMMLLFSIPNEGNIPFEYSIMKDNELFSNPDNAEKLTYRDSYFNVDPSSGTIAAGESLNISGSFQAITTGVYRQRFVVKSNDDDILKFTLLGQVGNPELQISAENLDFGLIERGKSYSKALIITNVGSYKDQWRVECKSMETDTEFIKPTFFVNVDHGETLAKHSSAIPVFFEPPEEGEFKGILKIFWSKDVLTVDLFGTGGGARLHVSFIEPADKTLDGLDFGTCIVGMRLEKCMLLKNIGTVDAILQLSHPNDCITFDIPRNDIGEIRIAPGRQIEAKVYLTPVQPDIIREPITVDLGASGIRTISLKAKCGAHSWICSGALDFLNMPIGESQSKIISVQNSGTLEIPFEVH